MKKYAGFSERIVENPRWDEAECSLEDYHYSWWDCEYRYSKWNAQTSGLK